MAYSRMVLGVHFPTNVLAGLMTGLASVLGVYLLMRGRIKGEERLEGQKRKYHQTNY